MDEFFRMAVAILSANLVTVILVYSVVLISRDEARRALSIICASTALFGGLFLFAWFYFFREGVHGLIVISSIASVVMGGCWLVYDMAYSMNQKPPPQT